MNTLRVLRALVECGSASGQEAKIEQWVQQYLQGAGLQPEMVLANVVCHIPGQDRSKALIFNGHVDTVSAGDLARWHTPPLQAIVQDGKLYGLGASDMKSGVAVMLVIAEYYSQRKPSVDLWFHFVVQEETDGRGTHDVMAWFKKKHLKKYKQIAGILLEPTSLERIEIAHKGNVFLRLTTRGDGGHGSTPESIKRHAVTEMIAASKQLERLVHAWGTAYGDPLLGKPTVVLSSIQAGDANNPNKIADTCVATFDLRTTPKLHNKALQLIQKYFSGSVLVETVYDPLPGGYTAESENIVRLANKITGLPTTSTPGSTDMLFFTALGIPAIIFGPGDKTSEHKANEFAELGKIEQAIEYTKDIIAAF